MVDRNKSSMDYTSLGCCALAFVLYLNTLNAGFVYDDRRAILGNTDVSGTTPWMQAFQNDYWGTPLTDSGSHGSYRPLCVLSFKVNYLIGGYTPWGYHLINNLMHCLATGLVVKLARHFLSSVWGILVTGALFAAHPIHTEAVAGIVGRADLAACIFYLLTYLTFIKHIAWRERNDNRQWLALSLAIILSLCALLFKETAVTALVVCAIFDIIRGLCGFTDKNRYRTLGIITAALITTMYIRLSAIPRPIGSFSTADNPIAKTSSTWTRFLTFLYLPVFNFKLLVYPSILSFDWGMDAIPRITSIYDSRNLLSLSFYIVLLAVIWRSLKILYTHHTKSNFPRIAQQRKSRTKKKFPVMMNQIGTMMTNSNRIILSSMSSCGSSFSSPSSSLSSSSSSMFSSSSSSLSSSPSSSSSSLSSESMSEVATVSTTTATAAETASIAASLVKNECVCRICKQELMIRHTSSCRAINNNNVPGPYTECGCQLLLEKRYHWPNISSYSPSAFVFLHHEQQHVKLRATTAAAAATAAGSTTDLTTTSVLAANTMRTNNKINANDTIARKSSHLLLSSLSSSSSSKPLGIVHNSNSRNNCCNNNSKSRNNNNKKSCSNNNNNNNITSSSSNINNNNSNKKNNSNHSSNSSILNSLSSTRTTNSTVLIMSIAFLTLPFLPATNLFFYVGFVVAERLLYLPSVGYCLLVGFGVSKIIEPLRNPRKRIAVILCMSLVLSMLSAKTWKRNLDWRDEESLYRSAIGVNPPKALANLGSVLSSQGRYAEAKDALLAALKYRPNMADVHFNLGILHQNQQNFKSAVENFQRAIQFRPHLAVAYLNLGTSLISLGRCQEAASVLKEGTKVDGTGVRDRVAHENARMSSYLQLGSLYADQGKLQRALAVYREALHSISTNYQREVLYNRIGDIFGRLQQWDEAEKYLRAALDLQPDLLAAHLSYGITLAKNTSRATEAELWFKKALELAPEQASVHHHYAEFLTACSRNEEAIIYRIHAAELSPKDYSLTVAAATALRLLDRKVEAEKWYRRAVQLRPNDARAHTNLGAILHLLGRTQKAAASYKEALRLQPGDPTTLGNLAKLGILEVK